MCSNKPCESLFKSSSLIGSIDGSSKRFCSCRRLTVVNVWSGFFLANRFFLNGLFKTMASAASWAEERFFNGFISVVSTPIDDVDGINVESFGVLFSIVKVGMVRWRALRIFLSFIIESICSYGRSLRGGSDVELCSLKE